MTLNDLEWLFHDKMRFWPALLGSERFNVRNSTTSAILWCSVHFTIYMYLYLYSYRRETARQLRIYAQLTCCFSAVAELLVTYANLLPWVTINCNVLPTANAGQYATSHCKPLLFWF